MAMTAKQINDLGDRLVKEGELLPEEREAFVSSAIKEFDAGFESPHKPGTFPVADAAMDIWDKGLRSLQAIAAGKVTGNEVTKQRIQKILGTTPGSGITNQLKEAISNLGGEPEGGPTPSDMSVIPIPEGAKPYVDFGANVINDAILTKAFNLQPPVQLLQGKIPNTPPLKAGAIPPRTLVEPTSFPVAGAPRPQGSGPLESLSALGSKLSKKGARGLYRSATKPVDVNTSKWAQFAENIQGKGKYPLGDLLYEKGITGSSEELLGRVTDIRKAAGNKMGAIEKSLSNEIIKPQEGLGRFVEYAKELVGDDTATEALSNLTRFYNKYRAGLKRGSHPYFRKERFSPWASRRGPARYSRDLPSVRKRASRLNREAAGGNIFKQGHSDDLYRKGIAKWAKGEKEAVVNRIAEKVDPDTFRAYQRANKDYNVISAAEDAMINEARKAGRKAPITQVDAMGLGYFVNRPDIAAPILAAKKAQQVLRSPKFLTKAGKKLKDLGELIDEFPVIDSIVRQKFLEESQ